MRKEGTNIHVLTIKKHHTKMVIFGSKNFFYTYFFLNYLKTVICELMLLELGDLLVSSLLRNFFSAGRVIFSCKTYIFIKIAPH